MYFTENILKWTLFNAVGADADVSPDNLEKWERELRDKYEQALTEELPRHNIAATKDNRSEIVLLAIIGFRIGRRRRSRVEQACEYFRKCHQIA